MQINKISNINSSFGMPVANTVRSTLNILPSKEASQCLEILKKLNETTPLHTIYRSDWGLFPSWIAKPLANTRAKAIEVEEGIFLHSTPLSALKKFAKLLSKEYKRISKH